MVDKYKFLPDMLKKYGIPRKTWWLIDLPKEMYLKLPAHCQDDNVCRFWDNDGTTFCAPQKGTVKKGAAVGNWIAYWDGKDWMIDENTYLSDLYETYKCDPYIYNDDESDPTLFL